MLVMAREPIACGTRVTLACTLRFRNGKDTSAAAIARVGVGAAGLDRLGRMRKPRLLGGVLRRAGLVRMLLTKSIAHAPTIGVHTLLGYIFGHNEPSLHLFEAHSFTRWAHLPRSAVLDGVERDLIIVGRRV